MGGRPRDLVRARESSGRKRHGTIATAATLAFAALVAACDGVDTDYNLAQKRAQDYIGAHPDLAPDIAGAIRANTIRNGMTMEQVTAAWGRPAVVQKFRDGAVELWYFGCDWPNFCDVSNRMGPGPGEIYNSRALFEKGVVTEWRN